MKSIFPSILILGILPSLACAHADDQDGPFKDVVASDGNQWVSMAISGLIDFEISNGYPGHVFKGGRAVTRFEAATALERVFKRFMSKLTPEPPATDLGTGVYADAKDTPAWAIDGYQDIVEKRHLMRGESSEKFVGNSALPRFELADFFYNICLQYRIPEAPLNPRKFTDLSPDNSHAKAVQYLLNQNILIGYKDFTFRGEAPATRFEFARALSNLMKTLRTAAGE